MPRMPTRLIARYPRSIAAISVILIAQMLELLLLQRKYDIFTGGFLQPYSYVTASDRMLYVTLTVWMDLYVYGVLALLWYRLADFIRMRPVLAAYNYFSAGSVIIVIWLTIRYKVLTYFSDTLNFSIIKNLGGGSISSALIYVVDEASIIVIMLLVFLGLYLLGLHMVRSVCRESESTQANRMNLPVSRWIIAGLVITALLIVTINNSPELRYGVNKKTSFMLVSTFLDFVTDLDKDSYGAFVYPTDPDAFNSTIYPGALDIPNNGIDEDMFGGDFTPTSNELDSFESLVPRAGLHIILIVLESARADLIDKHVNGKSVAPNISEIASAGSTIRYAYTHTGYTTSTLKAIFNRSLSSNQRRITLVDYLKNSGYTLSFLSGQDESFGDVASSVGMKDQASYLFDARTAINDRVYPSTESGSLRLSEARVVQEFQRRTKILDWTQSQFIYVNFQAAHFPYNHPTMPSLINDQPIPRSDITAKNQDWLEATYWNAIANADWAVGEIVNQLKMLDVYDESLVIIIGDHGESLFDDGFLGHGHLLNEAQTRIPLVINRSGLDIQQAIGQLDLAELMVSLATGQYHAGKWQDEDSTVFQLVGPLHRPQLVGTVSYGERRTILDLRMQRVYFSDLERWMDFDTVIEDPKLGPRTRELILQWEMLRWNDYNSREKPAETGGYQGNDSN